MLNLMNGAGKALFLLHPWYLSSEFKIGSDAPTVALDFKNRRYATNQSGKMFDDVLTFSRASEQTFIDDSGLMQSAAINEPAINHHDINRGFAHFEARTQMLDYSNFTGTGASPNNWLAAADGGAPVVSDYGDADGAQAYEFTAINQRNYIYKTSTTLSANSIYTFSIYVESNEDNLPLNQMYTAAGLPSGAVFDYPYGLNGAYIPASGERLYFRIITAGTPGTVSLRIGIGTSGNSTGMVRLSRPQLELGSFPSSFKPTNGANASTALNSAYISGTDYTDANIDSTQGTFYVEIPACAVDATQDYVLAHEAISGHYTRLFVQENGGEKTVFLDVVKNGSYTARMSQSFDSFPLRVAYTYEDGDIRLAVNDRPIVTDAGRSMEAMPNAYRVVIGDRTYSTSSAFNGYFSRVVYYPNAVSDELLYNRAVNGLVVYTIGGDSYAANANGKGISASLENEGVSYNNIANGGDTLAEQEAIVLADEYAGYRPLIFMDGSVNGHGTVAQDIMRYQAIYDGYNGKVVFLSPILYPVYYNTTDGQHALDLSAAMLAQGWDVVDSTAIARELSGVTFSDAGNASDAGYNDDAYDSLFQVDNVHPETALADALADAARSLL